MIQPDPAVVQALNAAGAARQRGRPDEEVQLLDAALARFPGSAHVHNARGMRALADRDAALAARCFTAAIEHDRREPALTLNLAAAHRLAGEDDDEQAALEAALALDARHFLANLRLAELHARRGRLSDAARHWSAVVQLIEGMESIPPAAQDALRRGRAFLAEHNAAYARALEAELGETLREGRRFSACVDHMLGRRRVYRNDCAGVYFPFLPADEFFDRAHFPWLAAIEARTEAIRAEALALLSDGDTALRPYVRLSAGTPENKWTSLDGSLDWGACFLWEYGTRNEQVCARCPETAAALDLAPRNIVPGKAPSAFFSVLKPGARIPPHTGVTNTRAIIHLPLVVPPGCGFRVGGETRDWREGEAFAFDDTIEHEAWNDSDQRRIVLIFDVWNPHLSAREQEQLVRLFAVADRGLVSPKA